MRRPETHQIDEIAQRVFRDCLPPSWIANEQGKDYGKDYLVEIVQDDKVTGKSFFVQLKGQKAVRVTREHVKFSLESKYAEYYAEEVKDLPVFLIVIDCTKRLGWWCFMQETLEDDVRWRTQNSFTLAIPKRNSLGNVPALTDAVTKAQNWMRTRHPSSIQDALEARRRKLMKLDSRFDYQFSIANGVLQTILNPVSDPVSVTFRFKGEPEDLQKKVHDLIGRGRKVRFEEGEIEFEGSNIFSEVQGGPVELHWSIAEPGSVTIKLMSDGQLKCRLNEVPGTFFGGHAEQNFQSSMTGAPIDVSSSEMNSISGKMNIKFAFKNWDDRPILLLPYFDKIAPFLEAFGFCEQISCEYFCQGNKIGSTYPSNIELPNKMLISEVTETIRKAREVLRKFGRNPIWKLSSYNEDLCDTVDLAYALLFEGGLEKELPNFKQSFTVEAPTFNPAALTQSKEAGLLRMETESFRVIILDEEMELGSVVHEYSNVIVQRPIESLNEDKNKIDLFLVGTASTKWKIFRDESSSA